MQQPPHSHMPRAWRSLILWLALATISTAHAAPPWRVSSQSERIELGQGAYQIDKTLQGPAELELSLIFFNSKQCTIQVVDQSSSQSALNLDQIARQNSAAIAGCNGGYFTPEFSPLGLVVASSQRAGAFQRSSLLGGFIQVRKDRPSLLWRDEYANEPNVTDLLQAGPRLVAGGNPVKGLEAISNRPRTFILTDNNGNWAIGKCEQATLRHLSDALAADSTIAEMEVDRALNLDGGRSSALWWKSSSGSIGYSRGYATVRNFLLVVPRRK